MPDYQQKPLIAKLAGIIQSNDPYLNSKKDKYISVRNQLDQIIDHAVDRGKFWFQTEGNPEDDGVLSRVYLCPSHWKPELDAPAKGKQFAFNRIKNLEKDWVIVKGVFTKKSKGLKIFTAFIKKLPYQKDIGAFLRALISTYAED